MTETMRTTDPEMAAMGTVRGLLHGRWQAQVLRAAIELEIPGLLADRPMTAAEVATELPASVDGTARLLRLLACLGVLGHDGPAPAYRLSDAGRPLLPDDPATVARDAAYTLSAPVCGAWERLAEVVRGADPLAGSLPVDDPAIAAYRAGVARGTVTALLATLPAVFSAAPTVLVVGTANQPLLDGLLAEHESLTGELVGTDRLLGPGPAGVGPASLVVLPHVLHDLDDDGARLLLERAVGALAPGGSVIVVGAARRRPGSPPLAAYLDVQQMLVGPGRERSQEEYRALLGAAGLRTTEARDLVGRPGIQVLTATR